MFIQKLMLQNYRCFTDETFSFDKPFVLIEGDNGSGKTTVLEALHYGCFLKSFRTNTIRDLVSFDQKHFFIKVDFEENDGDHNQVSVGVSLEDYSPKKRLVRFNEKVIKSYKDLISRYRIVSLSEDDLQLVQGAPEVRRSFLNQLTVLFNPDFITVLKNYRQVKEHRNSIFINGRRSNDELETWTKQLWEQSLEIQKERISYLKELETDVNKLLSKHFESAGLKIAFKYTIRNDIAKESFDHFWLCYKKGKLDTEFKMKRSLFGAHLDDFTIIFQGKKARNFASRGQQKLVVFLIKIALAQQLESKNMRVSLLLDDFLTDFDHTRLTNCLSLLSKLSCQIFITCPLKSLILDHYEGEKGDVQVVSM